MSVKNDEELKDLLYQIISPESFENSNMKNILSENLSFTLDELFSLKEIQKITPEKEKLSNLLSQIDFLTQNQNTFTYNIPENNHVFSILNIPAKLNKAEVIKTIELINLEYNRLYKNGFYWILSTNDKETIICVQNSLREMIFDDTKVKYDIKNKNQLLKTMREIIEKKSYKNETKNLGIKNKGTFDKKDNNNNKEKDDDDAMSWRKGSGEKFSSFDSGNNNNNNNNNIYKKNSYNNNNYNKNFKRNRFNSDNGPSRFNNYNNNNRNNYYNKNNYNNNNNNYNNNKNNNNNNSNEIEIDISNLKYPIQIKYKYSFSEIKNFFNKLDENDFLKNKPNFLSNNVEDILSENPKKIISLDKLIEDLEKNKINIPKNNPLMNLSKNNNKFDLVNQENK